MSKPLSDSKSKNWSVLNIQAAGEIREIISALLSSDCHGSIEDVNQTRIYFDPEQQVEIESRVNKFADNHAVSWNWETQEAEPWHLAWKDNFTPVNVRDRIKIIPDWDEPDDDETVIRIRPGMAFGTGHHETTFLMIDALLNELKPGMCVLDVGTGSGILAIAAAKLGAESVLGIEYDDACTENFQENLELNDIQSGIQFQLADALTWQNYDFDLILANVNRHVILQLIPNMSKTAGRIIFSGLLITDIEIIQKKLESHNLNIAAQTIRGEWACLLVDPVI